MGYGDVNALSLKRDLMHHVSNSCLPPHHGFLGEDVRRCTQYQGKALQEGQLDLSYHRPVGSNLL